MKVAICGYPPLAEKMQTAFKDIEFKFFISDFVSDSLGGENFITTLPLINFFQFRLLVNFGELDGVIIAEDGRNFFTKDIIYLCKLYNIPQVGIIFLDRFNPISPIYWLDPDKAYVAVVNTNVIDACNLNCKGCTHFASLFNQNEIYPLETFQRDVQKFSEIADVISFALLGGEPLLLKNLDEYIRITRKYFPKTNIRVITNGLLIPKMSQAIIDALVETKAVIAVSTYPPTLKLLDKIKAVLDENKIFYDIGKPIKTFGVFLTLHTGNNPEKARRYCAGNDICRFLRNGKIYKCPPDALKFRLEEKFGFERLPPATGVNLYAPNFSLLIKMLDDNVEMCSWCSEQPTRRIPWEPSNNPKLEDWLANPNELKNFQQN